MTYDDGGFAGLVPPGGGGGGGVSSDQIAAWYRQYLGRDASPDEIAKWQQGAYGATDAAGIEGQIKTSGEAQAYGGGRDSWGTGQGVGEAGPWQPSPGGWSGAPTDGRELGGFTGAPPGGFGAAGPAGGGGDGNYWGASTTTSPFGPWQGRYTAPGATPLPDAPGFTPPAYPTPPAFAYDESHPAPTYTPPPAFSYADFVGPTADEALNDPGYQFRTQQGQTALQHAAAARGTLGDTGTFKALIDYGQGAASQEYQNVWNRDYGAYQTNRGNALDTYTTNYKTQVQDPYTAALNAWTTGRGNALDAYKVNYQTQVQDPYAASYKAAQDTFAPRLLGYQTQAQDTQHKNDLANTNAWNDYLLGWQDYEQRRQQGLTFALGS